MSNLQEMTRVLYRHDWTSVDQWANNLDQLADLSDPEIDELERLGTVQALWCPVRHGTL
jgi:hypothetical protein